MCDRWVSAWGKFPSSDRVAGSNSSANSPRSLAVADAWKVERSLAWLLANRRLTIRYERRADILTALLQLACALICVRKL